MTQCSYGKTCDELPILVGFLAQEKCYFEKSTLKLRNYIICLHNVALHLGENNGYGI